MLKFRQSTVLPWDGSINREMNGDMIPVVTNTRKFITPAAVPLTWEGFVSFIIENGIIAAPDEIPRSNATE